MSLLHLLPETISKKFLKQGQQVSEFENKEYQGKKIYWFGYNIIVLFLDVEFYTTVSIQSICSCSICGKWFFVHQKILIVYIHFKLSFRVFKTLENWINDPHWKSMESWLRTKNWSSVVVIMHIFFIEIYKRVAYHAGDVAERK